jgi:DNA modification methylase
MATGWQSRIVGHEEIAPDQLLANPLNWRIHPKAQQEALGTVLDEVGWVQTVVMNKTTGHVLDGHLRVSMAISRDEPTVPVTVVELTVDEERLILATLDPLAAMAVTDKDILAELIADIAIPEGALADLAALTLDADPPALGNDTEPEEPVEEPYVKLGDVWQVGEHRIMCGDSTDAEDVARLLGGAVVELCHADPPYGMGKESEGVIGDNQYGDKLDAFQMDWWRAVRPHLLDNASAYIWGNAEDLWRLWWRGGLSDSERMTLRNEITWDKAVGGNPTMMVEGVPFEARRMYHPTERCLFFMLGEQGFNTNADNYWDGWEPIRAALAADCDEMGWGAADIAEICGVGMYGHWFTKSQWTLIPEEHYLKLQKAARNHDAFKRNHDAFKRDHDELKRDHDELKQAFYATRAHFDNTHDTMTDVWKFPKVEGEERHGHATPKPVPMIERAILSSTPEGGSVIEPFLGSGTTAIAAANQGRKCYGMEISPAYAQVSIERLAKHIDAKPKKIKK